MKIASHLMVSRHGVYYLRFVIPQALRPYFQGRGEIRKSLKTRDPRYAKIVVKEIGFTIERAFLAISRGKGAQGMDPEFVKYELVVTTPKGDRIEVKTDPNNPEDHKHALEAIQHALQAFHATPSSAPSVWFGDEPLKISEVASKYFAVNGQKWAPRTRSDYESIVRDFTDFCNDDLIHKITQTHIADYKVHLLRPREGRRTVHTRRLDFCISALNGFFNYAIASGYYNKANAPTTGQRVMSKRDHSKSDGYKIFSNEDLAAIFDPINLSSLKKPHEFWIPVLGLFTGARINELAQLDVSDVSSSDGIYFIRITDQGSDTKSVKTACSKRVIPLHQALLDIGFLDYLEDVRKLGEAGCRVFPYLAYRPGSGYGDVPSEAFARYLVKLGLKEKNKVFHSFRKTMNNRLKELGVNEETRSQLTGHAYESINSTVYSEPHKLQFLKNTIDTLFFETVDTAKLKYLPGQFLESLKDEMARRMRSDLNKGARQRRGK